MYRNSGTYESDNDLERTAAITKLHGSTNLGRTERISPRAKPNNWSQIRQDFVLGKRYQTPEGTWVTEDYTHQELADKYGLSKATISCRASLEKWSKFRKAYLSRIDELNIGQDLGLYTTENYISEVATLNACNKLSQVVDTYIEAKFGQILEMSEDVTMTLTEEDKEEIAATVSMKDIRDAIAVVKEVYSLQRKVYETSPNGMRELSDTVAADAPALSDKERARKIQSLKASLGIIDVQHEEV